MRSISRIVACAIGLAFGIPCSIAWTQTKAPTTVLIVSEANASTFAVGQDLAFGVIVGTSSSSLTPTGTVQFLANGQPIGSPVALSTTALSVPTASIQVPGSYVLTGSYSGDANFASATSTNSFSIQILVDPPTFVLTASPTSLTLNAGATTGNTVSVTMAAVNGCGCSSLYYETIAPVVGMPTPSDPATISLPGGTHDADGNYVFPIVVNSTAAKTIVIGAANTSPIRGRISLISFAALILLFPLSRRRLRVPLLAIFCLLTLPLLSGCGSSRLPSTKTETIPGSAGMYTITIYGPANDLSTGTSTYFSLKIPVTIQ